MLCRKIIRLFVVDFVIFGYFSTVHFPQALLSFIYLFIIYLSRCRQQTYLGHKFEVHDKATGRLLLAVTAEYHGAHIIGQYKIKNDLPHAELIIKSTLDHEWDRSRRVHRTFTDVGFALGQLPIDLYSSMSAYYYNNRHHLALEEWGDKGAFINWWQV